MTDKTRQILIRQSETRQRINELAAVDEPTEAQELERKKLAATMGEIEREFRAALAEPDTSRDVSIETTELEPEERERRELRGKARLTGYVSAALTGQPVSGAEAAYADAEGCPGMVPISMMEPSAEERQRETRAVSEAPADADLQRIPDPIVPALFDRSIAAWLGVSMPSVPTGIKSFPILSKSLTAGFKAEDATADESAGEFTVSDASPARLTGSFRIRVEDIAKMAGMEEALRRNLRDVMSDQLDDQFLNGNGTAPNLNGVFQQLTDPTAPPAQAGLGATAFEDYMGSFTDHIDGLNATTEADVRALLGVSTYRRMAALFRVGTDTTFTEHWRRVGGGLRATRRIAAAPTTGTDANIQQAVIRRANPAGDRIMAAPVWAGMEIIRDVYTSAPKGQIVLTAYSLVGGIVILRPGSIVQDSFRIA